MTKFLFAFAMTVAFLAVQVDASTKQLSHEAQVECIGGKGGSSCTKAMGCDPCVKPAGCMHVASGPGGTIHNCMCTLPGSSGFGLPTIPPTQYFSCLDVPASTTCTEASANVCDNKNTANDPAPVYNGTTGTWSCGGGTCTQDTPIVPSAISRCIP